MAIIEKHIHLTDNVEMKCYQFDDVQDYEIIVGINLQKCNILLEDDEQVTRILTSGSISLRQSQKMKQQLNAFKACHGFTERVKARIIVHFSF